MGNDVRVLSNMKGDDVREISNMKGDVRVISNMKGDAVSLVMSGVVGEGQKVFSCHSCVHATHHSNIEPKSCCQWIIMIANFCSSKCTYKV